jgi:hypothetical protein
MLSPRNLIFGTYELYWDSFVDYPKWEMYRLPEKPSASDWHTVVEDYTSRVLTDERDKLPALEGIARFYAQATRKIYLCGLWKETVICDLLWTHRWMQHGNAAKFQPPVLYRGPSWSWASVNGNCTYCETIPDIDSGTSFTPRTEVLAVFPDSGQDTSDKPQEGDEWLSLCGPLRRANFEDDNLKIGSEHSFDRATAVMDMRYANHPVPEEWFMGMTMTISDVWCLLLGVYVEDKSPIGLGLVLTRAIEHGEGKYRRLGMFTINGSKCRAFKNCIDSDVILI